MDTKIISFRSPSHILAGMGAIDQLKEEVKVFNAKSALLATDKGILEFGLDQKVREQLQDAGIEVDVFDQVVSDPDIACADACTEMAKAGNYDLIIGLGGGSPMDIASAAAVMCTNPGSIHDYLGIGLVKNPAVPSVLIPTTSGTGAEATPNAILTDTEAKLKKAIVSPHIFADLVILDPELTMSMPQDVTSWSGIDALTHAIECYTSNKANVFSDLLAKDAIVRISRSLRTAVADGNNVAARYDMAMASLYAGMTITLAGTTAVHALAYPLGGQYSIRHGVANGLLLPYVMEFNAMGSIDKFAEVAYLMGENIDHMTLLEQARHAATAVQALYEDLVIPQSLTELGIPRDAIPEMAEAAMAVTRLMGNNPRTMTAADAVEIYEKAY